MSDLMAFNFLHMSNGNSVCLAEMQGKCSNQDHTVPPASPCTWKLLFCRRERDYLANAGSSKCVCSAGQSQMFPIYAESCVQKWLLVPVSCWCLPKPFWGRQRALSLASSHTRASASFKIRAVICDTYVKSPCKKSKCYSQTAFTESSATGAVRLLLCFYILSNPVSNITHHVSHCI